MAKVEDVKVLNIDEVPYAVDAMSEAVQAMVTVFNGWNQKEADLRDELMMVQAAKNDLSRRIILQVREDRDAEAEGNSDPTEGQEVTDEAVNVDAE